ncbi:MAG: 2Fe-2S iron-sulfur cluster binding domain-containing protein [Pseudomonadota bacterium]
MTTDSGGSCSHRVTLQFLDGESQTITVAEDESLLTAAKAQSVPILHQCESGSCGSCSVRLTSGELIMRSDVAASLLASEHAAGMRLACISHPKSDCDVELEYASDATSLKPGKAVVFLDDIEWIAQDVVKLSTELAEGDWLDFQPGQFVQLQVPGTDAFRRYSMSSTPSQIPKLEFLIRVLPDGVMSNYLRNDARVDDTLALEGPFGSFFLRENAKRAPILMIAGGTGLAPMMSMLDVIRARSGLKPKILVSFGCAAMDNLFYVDELDLRKDWMAGLETRISVDKGRSERDIVIGNPLQAIAAGDISEDTVAYLCGPPPMIEASYAHLSQLGVRAENIYAEQFIPS